MRRATSGPGCGFNHAAQVEVFDADHIETGNEIGAQLVQRVATAIGDLLVDAGDVALDLHASLAALRSTSKALLVEGQPRCHLRRASIADALAVRQRCEARDAEVDTDRFAGFGSGAGCVSTTSDMKYLPLAVRSRRIEDGCGIALRDHLTFDRADLGELENRPPGVEREAALGVVRRPPRLLRLKDGTRRVCRRSWKTRPVKSRRAFAGRR